MMEFTHERIHTDVLIIGSGAAAGMAALEATKYNLEVLLVEHGRLGRSGSSATAGAGTAAAFGHTVLGEKGNPDTTQQHFEDIVKKGRYLGNQKLVRLMVDEIRDIVRHLIEIGIPYEMTTDGLFYQNQGVGQTFARNCTPRGNGAIVTELLLKEAGFRGVTLLERTRIVKLFKNNNRIIGALGVDAHKKKLYFISARSIIIAAGSATALQNYASASFKTNGDSFWLAYDAGADLSNMEILEFSFVPLLDQKAVPCGGSTQLTSRGSRFYNATGERFMERYNPETLEKTTRAVLISAFYREMKNGRGPVYMDCASIAPELWRNWEKIGHPFLNFMKAAGIDYEKGKVHLVPALHCFLGGIVIDQWGRTNVEGLYAAGEATTGIHGAVRLGGSAFAECFVFGKRAGAQAACEAKNREHIGINADEAELYVNDLTGADRKNGAADLAAKLEQVKDMAWKSIGVVRNRPELLKGSEFFKEVYEQFPGYNVLNPAELNLKVTLRNLSLTAVLSSRAALAREETRGGHDREDFPGENRDYLVNFVFNRESRFEYRQEPIRFEPGDLIPE